MILDGDVKQNIIIEFMEHVEQNILKLFRLMTKGGVIRYLGHIQLLYLQMTLFKFWLS